MADEPQQQPAEEQAPQAPADAVAPEAQQEAAAPAAAAPEEQPAAEEPAADAAASGEAAAAASVDAAAAAAQAAAVAAKLMAQHAGAEGAEPNNKRPREEEGEEGGPDKKRASAGALEATNGGGLAADPPAGQGPMEVMDIPANAVGKLIGKAGETIRNLQLSTDTRIQVDHAGEGDTKRVTITGMSAEAVAKCKAEINSILMDEESKEELDCPAGIVGRIIGRGGETIRALQSASQAHITVDQNYPEGQPRKVIVQGRPDACRRAVMIIKELINGEPGSAQAIIQRVCQEQGIGKTHVLHAPKGIVGRIIGRQGETIKQLQRVTGATVQIDQGGDPCRVTVAGQPASADQAKRMIEDIIAGGDPFGHGGAPGGGFGGPPFGGPPGGFGGPPGGFGGPPFGAPFGAPYGGGFPPYGGGFPPYGGAPGPYGAPGYGAPDPYAAAGPYGGAPGYGAPGGYGAPAAPPAAAPQWQELHDDQGRPYYYNAATGVTQWEKPPGM